MRVLKLSFDPSMPGEAWHTDEHGKPRGGSFDGQWYVFEKFRDGTTSEPLFHASTANECHQWIRDNRIPCASPSSAQ